MCMPSSKIAFIHSDLYILSASSEMEPSVSFWEHQTPKFATLSPSPSTPTQRI